MHYFGMIQTSPLGIILLVGILLSFVIPTAIGIYLVINFLSAPERYRKPVYKDSPETRFAVLVPARNESAVIRHTIGKLGALDYPEDRMDVIVIADNCTDNTAALAAEAGAKVYVRSDLTKMSKAHALKWLLDHEDFQNERYDAICIVDADAVLAPDFLRVMDHEIRSGYEIIQGRCGSTNPYDSTTSGFMTVLASLQNRLWYLPQATRNRSVVYIGTGVCITMDRIAKTGWNITTLVEDAEFSIQSVLKGGFVRYSDHARYYVEQVTTLRQLWKQQRRWRTGQIDCLKKYLKPILRNVFKEKNKNAIALLILILIPITCISTLFQLVVTPILIGEFLGYENLQPLYIAGGFLLNTAMMFIGYTLVLWLDGIFSIRLWKGILMAIFAPYFYGIVDIASIFRPKKEWNPILHGQSRWFQDKKGRRQLGTASRSRIENWKKMRSKISRKQEAVRRKVKPRPVKVGKKQQIEWVSRKK